MYYTKNPINQSGDRFFPVFPFIVGAVAGGAAVGLTRPRPVYVNPAYPQFNPALPYGSSGYSYYYPMRPF